MFSKVCTDSIDDVNQTEEIFDFQQLNNEIEEMHMDLDILQDRLHITVAHCPVKFPTTCTNDEWGRLYGSQQPDIRNLQLQTRNLKMQLGELKKCSQIAKLRIQGLEKRRCEQETSLFELQGKYDWIHSKYLLMEHNHGKCLQRYRHSRSVYATWTEVHQSGDHLKALYGFFLDQLHDRPTYSAQKTHVLKELDLANSRCMGAIQISLMRAKELSQQLDIFPIARPLLQHARHQQTLKDTSKRKQKSNEYYDDHFKITHVTVNFESEDAFDWDLQSRKPNLKHGSVSEIEIIKPPALSWYGRVQKLMSSNRKPSSLFLQRKN